MNEASLNAAEKADSRRAGLIRRVGDTLVRFLRGADHQFNIDPVCGFLQEKLDDQASATNGLSLPPAPRKKP